MLKNEKFIQKYFYIQTCLYFEKNLSQLHAEKIFLNEKKKSTNNQERKVSISTQIITSNTKLPIFMNFVHIYQVLNVKILTIYL